MPVTRNLLAALSCGILLSARSAAAGDPEMVAALFNKAGEHLRAQESFTVTLDLDYDLKLGDAAEDVNTDYAITFKRPDHVSAALENEAVQARFISTDQQSTTYISEFSGYTVEEESTPPAELIAKSAYGILTHGMFLLSELVKDEPFAGLIQNATDLQLVEENHARFNHDGIQWDVWFEKSNGNLLIDRYTPDLTPILQQSNEAGPDSSIHLVYDFTNWSFDELDDNAFTFEAPEGIEKVASFRPPSPADALLGKPAPDFTLPLLGGGNLRLSDKGDSDVLILDFWATWCGPCRTAMPILERVANDFAEQDVKLYAVNLQEEPDEIRSFLESNGLEIDVALDKDGDISELYEVTGIPQTVIIGKDGTVQAVHVGVSPDLETELRTELDKLVKGEQLAKQ